MSLIEPQNIPCPSCGEAVLFQVAHSVNADRRPDIRDGVLSGDFQRQTCQSCQTSFRLDPELNYLDLARAQWIAVYPFTSMGDWENLEAAARETFSKAYGAKASATAREIGDTMQVRLVFGWAALREKILLLDHGLDDVELELAKIAILRASDNPPLSNENEMRLVSVDGDEFRMAWINAQSEDVVEALGVPREVYDGIAADRSGWEPLRQAVSAGLFVDSQRLMI